MDEIKKPPHMRWRTWLANMPPVDWDALAMRYRDRRNRKGDKRSLEIVRKIVGTRRRNRVARTKAAINRAIAERKARYRVPVFGVRLRVVHALARDVWRTQAEIRNVSGLSRDDVKWKLHNLRGAGLVERRDNPNWKRISATLEAPRFEYRLTAKGEAERERTSWMV